MTQFMFVLLNMFFKKLGPLFCFEFWGGLFGFWFLFLFFKNLLVADLLEEEFCRRIYFVNVRARLGTDISSQTQVECKGQPMCLTCKKSVCLCAAKAYPNSAQLLKAGLALELEDLLATSAHCKISAKCFFFSLLTSA